MNALSHRFGIRQRGIVSVMAAVILVVVVLFILNQTFGIIGTTSLSNQSQNDSTAALFLAESGLERARAIMKKSAAAGDLSESGFETALGSSAIDLGTRGNFRYLLDKTACLPEACNGDCASCSVSAKGAVGSVSRTVSLVTSIRTSMGTNGCGDAPALTLAATPANVPTGAPVVGIFNLAYRRLQNTWPAQCPAPGGGGNATAGIVCPSGASCGQQWYTESSSGQPSAGNMGVAVRFPFNKTARVNHSISAIRDYSLVGAMFPALDPSDATQPVIKGSYWADTGGSGIGTTNNNAGNPSSGTVSNGVAYDNDANDPAPTCTQLTINNTSTSLTQSCHNWCFGADTLVFGLAARSLDVTGQATAVSFNTASSVTTSPAQNVALQAPATGKWLAHIPNPDGSDEATGDIYSEIWYAFNPAYFSDPTYFANNGQASGATTYPRAVKGTVGATMTAKLKSGGTEIQIVSLTGLVTLNSDILAGSNIQPNTVITSGPFTCTTSGWSGTNCYTISPAATGNSNSASLTLASNKLYVLTSNGVTRNLTHLPGTGADHQINAIGSVVPGGLSINAAPVTSGLYTVYTLSAPTTLNGGNPVPITQGANSATTIYLPPTGAIPTASAQDAIIAVHNNQASYRGYFPAGTRIATIGADSFTISNPASAPIVDAVICGGTCALFNDPGNPGSTTQFKIWSTAGSGATGGGGVTNQWASGFVCLSGVDKNNIKAVTNNSLKTSAWREEIE